MGRHQVMKKHTIALSLGQDKLKSTGTANYS